MGTPGKYVSEAYRMVSLRFAIHSFINLTTHNILYLHDFSLIYFPHSFFHCLPSPFASPCLMLEYVLFPFFCVYYSTLHRSSFLVFFYLFQISREHSAKSAIGYRLFTAIRYSPLFAAIFSGPKSGLPQSRLSAIQHCGHLVIHIPEYITS